MSRILVTGSTDGIGLATATTLVSQGHNVVAHARSEARADEVRTQLRGTEAILVGDLSRRNDVDALVSAARALGDIDAIIHNAGIGSSEPARLETPEGLPHVLAINALAPYILSSLIPAPRLIFVSSGMHEQGDVTLSDVEWKRREWDALQAYADSKLMMITLAFSLARLWPNVSSNAADPGWVPTKMTIGQNPPDDLALAHLTQVWLATVETTDKLPSGQYFHRKTPKEPLELTLDPNFQDRVLEEMERLTGVSLPTS